MPNWHPALLPLYLYAENGSSWLCSTLPSQCFQAHNLPVTINLPIMRLPATTANMTIAHIIGRMQWRKKFLTKR